MRPSHPQHSLILRAMIAGHDDEADFQLREARPGDWYLLYSDRLHDVADDEQIGAVLRTGSDPGQAARDLVALAVAGSGPDNVTCIVADTTTARAA
jgi:PPM family protein phosphatase